jgi:hypothetical protein
MKQLILITIFLLLCKILLAPESRAVFIMQAKAINPYKRITEAIAWVETRNRSNMINFTELAYGKYQVRQVRLDDYHRRTGIRYTLTDMLDERKALKVFNYYANIIGWRDPERIARCWNGGMENGMRYRQTAEYWKLVKSNL